MSKNKRKLVDRALRRAMAITKQSRYRLVLLLIMILLLIVFNDTAED